jgi:cytochrome c-type biogenesis protein CcmH
MSPVTEFGMPALLGFSRKIALSAGLAFAVLGPAHAVNPDEMLTDPHLEKRARELSQELRCVVCQNQSIDDSSAPLAHDLRALLRERLVAGDSDQAAIDFIVARYGNFVLLKPPVHANTILLWTGPLIAALIALYSAYRYLRAQSVASSEIRKPFSSDDQTRLNALLGENDLR